MIYIITPCSRPENLTLIYDSIPKETHWIICHDKNTSVPHYPNSTIMICENTGMVGIKARNYVLDNFPFTDDDYILFHDDDNIIHPLLYSSIVKNLDKNFSIITWGQLNKNKSIRLYPPSLIEVGSIDTASFLVSWKYNKNIRHKIDTYEHDGIYAKECAKNGPVICINDYLCYYNYLRS